MYIYVYKNQVQNLVLSTATMIVLLPPLDTTAKPTGIHNTVGDKTRDDQSHRRPHHRRNQRTAVNCTTRGQTIP
jgi:hypothetical protein